jgi:hypothetical protein
MRQTHRSNRGPKLFALRDEKGRFLDIVEYKQQYSKYIKRKKRMLDKATHKSKLEVS